MTFENEERRRTRGFDNDDVRREKSKLRVIPREPVARDQVIRDLIGLMATSRKIQANRVNAKKSTGPKSARGKAVTKFNALKHGLFAIPRLIPGEDEAQHERLSARIIGELKPTCAIEGMLVDQIVADTWRLQRLDRAERAYLARVQKSVQERHLRLLSDAELISLVQHCSGHQPAHASAMAEPKPLQPKALGTAEGQIAVKPQTELVAAVSRPLEQQLDRIFDLGAALLESVVDPNRAFPYTTLAQIRRSLVRDILRKYDRIRLLQLRETTIKLPRAED